jgi:suppressor of G2 allele of SKP1
MSQKLIEEGNDLFVDEEYDTALAKYNEAIARDPQNVNAFVKRSACHFRLNQFTESLNDANTAIRINPKAEKPYYRKGIAAFSLDEFETARSAFREGFKISNKAMFRTWIRKCDAEINEDSDNVDDESSGEDVKMVIDSGNKSKEDVPPPLERDDDTKVNEPKVEIKPVYTPQNTTSNNNTPQQQSTQSNSNTNVQPPPQRKYQWFQTEDNVCVSFYIKNVKKENCRINIKPHHLEVSISTGPGSEHNFDMDLCDEVDPNNSRYDVLTTKIEVNLRKKQRGQWASLEKSEDSTVTPWRSTVTDPEVKANKEFPTSSKKKTNWDQLEKEAKEEAKKEGDGLNNFFHDIFKGGSDEQRRAIEKSFYESGGTVFSTNWNEVGKDKVKGSAPQGMEMKYWNETNK